MMHHQEAETLHPQPAGEAGDNPEEETMRGLIDWVKRWIVSTAVAELQDDMGTAGADPGPPPSVPLLEGPKKKAKSK